MEYGTGSFPTMGTSAAQLANVPPALGGELRPRGHGGKTKEPAEPTAAHRRASFERMGATLRPTPKIYAQNDPNASLTGRKVRNIPSKSSYTDNWRSAAKSLY